MIGFSDDGRVPMGEREPVDPFAKSPSAILVHDHAATDARAGVVAVRQR